MVNKYYQNQYTFTVDRLIHVLPFKNICIISLQKYHATFTIQNMISHFYKIQNIFSFHLCIVFLLKVSFNITTIHFLLSTVKVYMNFTTFKILLLLLLISYFTNSTVKYVLSFRAFSFTV
jgi:hypothetical protein